MVALATLAAAATLSAASLAASGHTRTPTKHLVRARYNALLERKVLTTTKGLTLYSLKIERQGKFACTGTCLSQVTYRGMPLYTYGGDSAPGQANGNGIVDVGRWHAAPVPSG